MSATPAILTTDVKAPDVRPVLETFRGQQAQCQREFPDTGDSNAGRNDNAFAQNAGSPAPATVRLNTVTWNGFLRFRSQRNLSYTDVSLE